MSWYDYFNVLGICRRQGYSESITFMPIRVVVQQAPPLSFEKYLQEQIINGGKIISTDFAVDNQGEYHFFALLDMPDTSENFGKED